MKLNLFAGMLLIGAMALSSCSTQNKLASAQNDDDVYFTKAKAGDAPAYTASANTDNYRHDDYQNAYRNDDYYYYDSYEARLNRFYGYSPFGTPFYSDLYYGYSPFSPYYSGLSLGLGLGYGAYGWGGYSPYYGFNPYGYLGYGYGGLYGYGSSYWGPYSYYNTAPGYVIVNGNNTGRPYRGSGLPAGYNGTNYTGYGSAGSYPPSNRPSRTSISTPGNGGQTVNSRPARTQTVQPQYQPQQQQYNPPPSNNSGGSYSGGSSSGGSVSSGRPMRQ